MTYSADPVADAARYMSALGRREALSARAYQYLETELRDALLQDPSRDVSTPAFARAQTPAMDVVADEFASASGDSLLFDLLRIAAEASQGRPEAQLRAQAWLKTMTERHAAFHADDLVRLIEGEE